MGSSNLDKPKRAKTGGRKPNTPNKLTLPLKEAILEAAKRAGGDSEDGMVKYLTLQAQVNPGPFMSLLGKVLPMQVTGADGGALTVEIKRFAG